MVCFGGGVLGLYLIASSVILSTSLPQVHKRSPKSCCFLVCFPGAKMAFVSSPPLVFFEALPLSISSPCHVVLFPFADVVFCIPYLHTVQ